MTTPANNGNGDNPKPPEDIEAVLRRLLPKDPKQTVLSPYTVLNEIIALRVSVARLDAKLDRARDDRNEIAKQGLQIDELTVFKARVQTWGMIAGAIWSLLLALIGADVWFGS